MAESPYNDNSEKAYAHVGGLKIRVDTQSDAGFAGLSLFMFIGKELIGTVIGRNGLWWSRASNEEDFHGPYNDSMTAMEVVVIGWSTPNNRKGTDR